MERNINVWLPIALPNWGPGAATQACALTRNRTSNPLVHRLALIHLATPARARPEFIWSLFFSVRYRSNCSPFQLATQLSKHD